jgi:hypothetical protein
LTHINPVAPTLEDVFIQLVQSDRGSDGD